MQMTEIPGGADIQPSTSTVYPRYLEHVDVILEPLKNIQTVPKTINA